jgi:RNA polymerase sigma factor (sigma-70 family)
VKATETKRTIEVIWRVESAKVIARIGRIVRDIGIAEELAQDALVTALERWPKSGIPDNPGAWLMTAAKHRAIDFVRRRKLLDRKHEEIGYELEIGNQDRRSIDESADDVIADDLLSLIFTACHPLLSQDARVSLTLRLLGGLTTDEIARAFLTAEPTIAQRIVRAKRTLSESKVPFEVPRGAELAARLGSVLEVIYLIFNEGYTASAGDAWMRPDLCEDALQLGRILAGLLPDEPEVHGLVALMEIQASRIPARTAPNGEAILLRDQNRALWNHTLIHSGIAALERAQKIGVAPGPYVLQAAIAACHARAFSSEQTDWVQIAALYETLSQLHPSPIVALNRAVAVSMAHGPEAALQIIDSIASDPALRDYHPLRAVRGDVLEKLGRYREAQSEFERGAALTRNEREKQLMLARADAAGEKEKGS